MEVNKRECEIVEHNKDDNTHITIVFTACTFLLMMCLKHFLVEQWRAWVFLLLNVILLAILFMSMRTSYKGQSYQIGTSVDEESKYEKKVKKGQCYECCEEIEEVKECYKQQCWTSTCTSNAHVLVQNETCEDEEEEQVPLLSKEELNERVEAFITMFRKHLISDVKQAENLRFQKTVNFTTKIEVPCC
ncbi:hypothetical protein TanjilG_13171 [Lupinus angustifolius]|uniref:uncharacterized protein LOC109336220 n=1 Tax=Lupinus angustifolius TaxID=3871 RepID=UPI00090DC666|nr:PREDICTED: uncharacterized protein LOC109336220 [Lupinus angustifolius]OIV90316.1 hypothetical protein TanjilG_13171 [Lupinus angustifolius]